MNQFPSELLLRYKTATNRLRKIQRVIFKRFAPNVSDVSEEFNQLAISMINANLPQYAGLCWLGASKCEKALGNTMAEIEYLLKSARAYVQANKDIDNLKLLSNDNEHLEGALRCYNQALHKLNDDSVLKAAIIREIKKNQLHSDITSAFVSPSHRIYDLELSVTESINTGDLIAALEKCTELFDDIIERKVQDLYNDVMRRNELTRVFLLMLLDLPPSRQSPSHIKLLEKFSTASGRTTDLELSLELFLAIADLILACQSCNKPDIIKSIDNVSLNPSITHEQHLILQELYNKYDD